MLKINGESNIETTDTFSDKSNDNFQSFYTSIHK